LNADTRLILTSKAKHHESTIPRNKEKGIRLLTRGAKRTRYGTKRMPTMIFSTLVDLRT
jgi:hypothetical protein